MNCACGGSSEVIDSRPDPKRNGHVRRRRRCLDCGERWTTYELRAIEPGSPDPVRLRLLACRRLLRAVDANLGDVMSGRVDLDATLSVSR